MGSTQPAAPVAVYVRISDDQAGEGLGVARQSKDCRRLADALAWPVVTDDYADNDVSAYNRRKKRPAFEQMLADAASGAVGGIVVYDLDRLARQPRDLERVIDLFEENPRLTFRTVTGDMNLATSDGRTMARVMVAFANKSSSDTGRRVARKHLENAENGVPVGGWRPFGWQPDKRTLDQQEAGAIREGARMLLSGAPINAVVAKWNADGFRTTATNRNAWVRQTVKQVYRNARLCGYRTRSAKGPDGKPTGAIEIVRREDGSPVIGQWAPILSVDEWEAVSALVAPGTKEGNSGFNARKYLLTGIARCGKCSKGVRAIRAMVRDGKVVGGPDNFYYACVGKAHGGCGGVSISGPSVDALITELLFRHVESRQVEAEPDMPQWTGQDDLERVSEQIAELTAAWRARSISGERYFALLPGLEAEEKTLTAQRRDHLAAVAIASASPVDLRGEWNGYTLAQKRAAISENISAVVIAPADKPGRRIFDAHRVTPVWRD